MAYSYIYSIELSYFFDTYLTYSSYQNSKHNILSISDEIFMTRNHPQTLEGLLHPFRKHPDPTRVLIRRLT